MIGPSPSVLTVAVETNFQLLGKVAEAWGDCCSSLGGRPQGEDTIAYNWAADVHAHAKEHV